MILTCHISIALICTIQYYIAVVGLLHTLTMILIIFNYLIIILITNIRV